jgi:hypothetical protein
VAMPDRLLTTLASVPARLRGSERAGNPIAMPDCWLPRILVSVPAPRDRAWRCRHEAAAPRAGLIAADAVRTCAASGC